jgi:pyruvate ferredoxin oxidoreductase gamma subunit
MIEVRFHGRGGMGVKMSAHLLGLTAFLSGYQTQDFALYGAERRGAPVTSFTRYDKKTVRERGYIQDPDAVIILDETMNFDAMLNGLKKDGFIIINSTKGSQYFKRKYNIKHPVYCIDATNIAIKYLGRPIANTAVLGSMIKFLGLPLKNLEKAIDIALKERGHPGMIKKNIQTVRETYKVMK